MLLALVGPTASGKTQAGLTVALTLGTEIISVDSMLVYRGMDVGTAKPTPKELASVAHHMIDVAEPSEPYSVAAYQEDARAASDRIRAKGARALIVGGSGLYFRALVDDLRFPGTDPDVRGALMKESEALGSERIYRRLRETDPVAADKIEPANVRRIVRALEVAAVTGKLFSDFAAAWDRYPPDRVRAA
jgi:tRNA dimethylallyltransferase